MADSRLRGKRPLCTFPSGWRSADSCGAGSSRSRSAGPRSACPPLIGVLALAAGLALGPGLVPAGAQGRPIVIKLATLAPTDSPWHDIYKEMGARWAQVSGGRVTLSIYPGGVAGEEPDVLRKMRIGQLHAGGLTLAGLSHITPAVIALAIPFVMETPEDLARVREVVEPKLEQLLAEKGYVVLNWGDVGWMRYFLPAADASPEAVKRYRFVSWSADRTTELSRDAGFRHVQLNLSDVLPGLQTGLADAVSTTPLVVLSNQWFPFVPYMIDMPWAPLVGATVVDKRVWDQILPELRPQLMAVAREAGVRLQTEILRMEADAIAAMVERGMNIITPTPEEAAAWRALYVAAYPKLRGSVIPEDLFDEVIWVAAQGKGR